MEALSELREYIREARLLRDTLDLAVSDLEFETRGGKIIYAVDFSEIFSYLFPGEAYDEFLYLTEDDRQDATSLQYLVLRHFFFNKAASRVLPSPYVFELESFHVRLREGVHDDLLTALISIAKQIDAILDTKEFKKYKAYLADLDVSTADITDLEPVVRYLEDNVPDLLLLARPPRLEAIHALRELMEKTIFVGLGEILERSGFVPQQTLDEGLVDRWADDLATRRRHSNPGSFASSAIDARALAILRQANSLLAESETQILLVSRSPHMHSLLREHVLLSGEGFFLRHPTSLYFLYGADSRSQKDEAKVQLRLMLDFLNNFVQSTEVDSIQASIARLDEYRLRFRHLLDSIQAKWKTAGFLSTALAEFSNAQMEDQLTPGGAQNGPGAVVKDLLNLFKGNKFAREVVRERLAEIQHALSSSHAKLGVLYQSADSTITDAALQSFIEMQMRDSVAIVRTERQAVPYCLEFVSADAKEILNSLRGGRFSLEDAIPLFVEGFNNWTSHYESLLAMSLVLATLKKWHLAEVYAQEAASIGEQSFGISNHESLFFLALCKRKHSISVERYEQALALIDDALSKKKSTDGIDDPRYLHEKGVLLLKMSSIAPSPSSDQHSLALQEGFLNISRAAELSGDDQLLKIQAMSNMLYYHLEYGNLQHADGVELYHQILVLQRSVVNDESQWAASLLDTLSMAHWRLVGVRSRADYEVVQKWFNFALASEHLEKSERQTIKGHLVDFANEFERSFK